LSSQRIEYDLLLVGGSPSNLTLAYRLLELAKESGKELSICILEKGKEFGSHILSGAVSHPHVLEKVWPNYRDLGFPIEAVCNDSNMSVLGIQKKWDIPSKLYPKSFDKTGYLVLTLSHVVQWMSRQIQEKAKEVPNVAIDLFTGFAAHGVVFEDGKVVGVKVTEDAKTEEDFVYAKITAFGDKGFISRDVIDHYKLRDNPQIWSVGVKEVWQCNEDYSGKVWHTLGWPLLDGTFGGGFVYGMKDKKLCIGMVISLDSPDPNMNPQLKLQEYKKHPWIQDLIKGGKLLKYGAALLPEGGFYSMPKKFYVPGGLLLGDALGVLNVKNLAGIDRAMECGRLAAEVLHEGFVKGDLSERQLAKYQSDLNHSFVMRDAFRDRYFRHTFKSNPRLLGTYLPKMIRGIDGGNIFSGMISAGLPNPFRAAFDGMTALDLMERGHDIGPIKYEPDYKDIIPSFVPPKYDEPPNFDKTTIYSRPDAVFYAGTKYHEGNQHIDEFNAEVCVECIKRYESLGKTVPCVADCTAEVHRIDIVSDLRRHGMSLENCIHCRTCEIVCPEVNLRVKPTEQGSGPDFMGL
jgi:electron-transferring-flavoprotein dehydrogenase